MKYAVVIIQQVEENPENVLTHVRNGLAKGGDAFEAVCAQIKQLWNVKPLRLSHATYINNRAEIGDMVLVPYGRYNCIGIVTDFTDDVNPEITYRPITRVLYTFEEIVNG